ncbi:MAG: hypothetical protein [Bacteriophage sp.]|nr:MAG: hypothetical protein [Bacteriophage sp.]
MKFIVLMVLYFVPTVLAFIRDHKSKWGILALNFILGFTVIGWIIALIWALSDKGQKEYLRY